MYDLPPSLPSPPPAVFVPSPPKMSRSNSPIPHISTLIPHHHHHHHHHASHHSQYSPNSRQADVSRLLDPTYASHNSSSSGSSSVRSASQQAQTRAYVDHHGDLHDPDYRDFPVLPPRPKSHAPRRRHTAGSTQLLHHHHSASRLPPAPARADRYSTYPLVARPEWERDWATEGEDADEDEETVDLSRSPAASTLGAGERPFAHSPSAHTTPSSRRASLPPSLYAHSTFFCGEPSPADSLEEEDALGLSASPFEDLAGEEFGDMEEEDAAVGASTSTSKGRASSLLRRMKRSGSQSSVPPLEPSPTHSQQQHLLHPPQPSPQHPPHSHSQQQQPHQTTAPPPPAPKEELGYEDDAARGPAYEFDEDEDDVPSCTHILRQQWRAVTLRLRFGVFHVQRRLATPRRKTL